MMHTRSLVNALIIGPTESIISKSSVNKGFERIITQGAYMPGCIR